MNQESHFNGKSVLQHLKEARAKGQRATESHHALESPGHLIGGADAARETSFVILVASMLLHALSISPDKISSFLTMIMFAMLLWRAGRGALLGWNRLERVNKLISDEKHEIEHNRQEEKEELTEMYRAKGFSGPLLEKVIDVLMADDNKLLGVMLEEELGVSLESYEHPLKQAAGTAAGVFLASSFLTIGMIAYPGWGVIIAAYLTILAASFLMAMLEKIRLINAIVWNLSLAFMASMGTFFLAKFLSGELFQ